MRSDEIDYRIIGNDLQMVEIELDPGETVIAEAGAMTYMEDGIVFQTKLGDGSDPDEGFLDKLIGAGKRILSQESLFMTHFTNRSNEKRRVAFSAPYPGQMIPVNLKLFNGVIYAQKDAFLCAALGTHIDIAFVKRLGVGFFGGEGFILEKLTGDGLVFIHACGTIIKKELNGQTLYVDTGCLVAFSDGIDYSISRAGGLKSMVFGGEGIFLARLSGSGIVYLQSLPFSRLADRIVESAPNLLGEQKGEGSILGGLGSIFKAD